jgi:hypothetical protein
MRRYSIPVERNLKTRRVTLRGLRPRHYLLNAASVIHPDTHSSDNIPNRPKLSPHVYEAVTV